MSNKAVLIVNGTLNSEGKEALAYYVEQATPMFVQAGGKPLGRYKIQDKIAGSGSANMTVVMEFPNSESIKQVFDSAAYQPLIPYRDKAFQNIDIFIGQE